MTGVAFAEDGHCIADDWRCTRHDMRHIAEYWRCTGQDMRCIAEDWRRTREDRRCTRQGMRCNAEDWRCTIQDWRCIADEWGFAVDGGGAEPLYAHSRGAVWAGPARTWLDQRRSRIRTGKLVGGPAAKRLTSAIPNISRIPGVKRARHPAACRMLGVDQKKGGMAAERRGEVLARDVAWMPDTPHA